MLTGIKARITAAHTFGVVKSGFLTPAQRLSSNKPMAAGDILATFAAARRLRADARAGTIGKPLRGKNLALLLDAPPGGEPSVLHRAALELGARVAEVRFTDPTGSASAWHEIRALARMLGHMYDAIDCATLAPATVRRIEQEAGLPIYEGLGLDDHPARALADLMTLCDHGSTPASEASILFLGDPWTIRARAFRAAAREIGFEVRVGKLSQAASSDASFVVDATRAPHWSLRAQTTSLDEARRSENHRCVMQTVLLDTIVKA